jgi:short-subunit dehydrogenase
MSCFLFEISYFSLSLLCNFVTRYRCITGSANSFLKKVSWLKTIFITGAGSGFGKIAALGLAQRGHKVIATAEIGPQVQTLRQEAEMRGISLEVQKLDLLSGIDKEKAKEHDIDVLLSCAGICEAGPIAEQPVDLIRAMFEVNVFSNLEFVQGFVRQMIEKRKGKIIMMSSMSGLVSFPLAGAYCASKHALEAIAEALKAELEPFGIKVATINPGSFKTGFNESGVDSIFRWYDPEKNFTSPNAIKKLEAALEKQLDPASILEIIVEIVESDKHTFRNTWPRSLENEVKKNQKNAWEVMS